LFFETDSGLLPEKMSAGCRENGNPVHPARFPIDLPLFFISMLTDPGDTVVDIFGGSNVTGWACEHTERKWLTFELDENYVAGSAFRFEPGCPVPDVDRVGARVPSAIRPIRISKKPLKLGTGAKRMNGKAHPGGEGEIVANRDAVRSLVVEKLSTEMHCAKAPSPKRSSETLF
jgi:hypothetical protein